MARIFVAAIVGALIVFIWGFLAWPTLDLYKGAKGTLPNEDAVIGALKVSDSPSAAYFFPAMPKKDAAPAAAEAWEAKRKEGPTGLILYNADGSEPSNNMMVMVRGFLFYVVGGFLMGCMMVASHLRTWGMRFTLAIIMSAFAVMASHASNWNWFSYPDGWAMAMATDVMVGWVLAGAVIAAIVKPSPARA